MEQFFKFWREHKSAHLNLGNCHDVVHTLPQTNTRMIRLTCTHTPHRRVCVCVCVCVCVHCGTPGE